MALSGMGALRGRTLLRVSCEYGIVSTSYTDYQPQDFHSILRQTSYQASSIHSRRPLSSIIHHHHDRTPNESPPPPPPPIPPPQESKRNSRIARYNRLLADIWLMSAATFRRSGKIEEVKGAIQEAEVRDETNPAVWVQVRRHSLPAIVFN
jgi:hypothetical protein